MGYPVEMIGKDTLLFSIIGESAIEAKKEYLFNNIFKELDLDMMVMPLNIRSDDIGFFLHNFKNSKVKGAYFSKEYWKVVANLIDGQSSEAKACGMVDSLDVKDGKNRAYVVAGKAVINLIQPNGKSVAIVGNSPLIKSIVYNLNQSDIKELILYDDVVERTLELSSLASDLNVDVERITENRVDIKADIIIVDKDNIKVECSGKKIDLNNEDDFLEIEKEIAKIKTKEWIENG